MKYFTHKYNNITFDFFIFGDRIFTNLSSIGNFSWLNSASPLIHKDIYTDIRSYVNQLSDLVTKYLKSVHLSNIVLIPLLKPNDINSIIQTINKYWDDNKKDFPDERTDFIAVASDKRFLPLIASHTLNKSLIDHFINLNDHSINCGLAQNPLLSTKQVIELIKSDPIFGHHLIQDTSYKILPELLHFFVSEDMLNKNAQDKYCYSLDIISYRDNLSEHDIIAILPVLNDNSIHKIILYQTLPQYINESLSLVYRNPNFSQHLAYKYKEHSPILEQITRLLGVV